MSVNQSVQVEASPIPEVERARAGLYGMLAALLDQPPGDALLRETSRLHGDDTPVGAALGRLAARAAAATADVVEREYTALFIGLGRGELVPYGSYYLTGFLNERPLAILRDDMARLDIAPGAGTAEPEDHIAAALEMMQGLIDGRFGAPASLDEQHRFYRQHVESWAGRFFADLENAISADFYRPVGELGRVFIDIETRAFAMA